MGAQLSWESICLTSRGSQVRALLFPPYMREWLSGRASPCQGERREFESRFPLHNRRYSQAVRPRSAKPLRPGSNPGGASKKFDKFRLVEFFYPLRKQWYIITLQRVSHHRRCISSAAGCILFRNDDIQCSALMICNSYGIDDIHGYAVILRLSSNP